MANFLTKLLTSTGSNKDAGLLPKAATLLDTDKAYKEHVLQSQEDGKDPMSREEFIKSRRMI